ncbi:MAG: hypothetical protein KGL50_06110 [Burkholderiales bacterium]|nr:hypothetical protein [Burkholderiales bacterium]
MTDAATMATLRATDWVDLAAVAQVFPQVHAVRLPHYVVQRDGGRQATVAAIAHALRVPSWKLAQALQAAALRRLAKG